MSDENNQESNSQGDGALQEAELWERIEKTEGVERAEVLAELSHFAYGRDDYQTCLQLVETSLDIYRNNSDSASTDRKSTRLNSSHSQQSRMPSSA